MTICESVESFLNTLTAQVREHGVGEIRVASDHETFMFGFRSPTMHCLIPIHIAAGKDLKDLHAFNLLVTEAARKGWEEPKVLN